MALAPGETLGGRYLVERPLAEGAFARVYVVRDVGSGARYALKLLHRPGDDARARFAREARLAAGLDHPNLVRVVDHLDGDDGPALVMELVEGETLRARLERGPLPLEEAAALGAGLLAGVAAAHAAGVVHRDLKPENVLLARDGAPRITDFGLARGPGEAGLTRAGQAMGTPGYMAPEVWDDAASADARADVFALGAILFELVAGRRAFLAEGRVSELWQSAAAGPPAVPEGCPPTLAEAIYLALQPSRAARPEDAGALLAAWRGEPRLEPPRGAAFTLSTFDDLPAAPPPVRLPAEADSFVGRDGDLDALERALDAARVTSILGPGGVGKTRCAIRLARRVAWRFSGGVYACDVTAAQDRDGVVRALAAALEVPLGQHDGAAQVGHALAARSDALVLLDNCEHLVPEVRALLGEWIGAAPSARFLVTSRIRLDLGGEHAYDLAPLPLPADGQWFTPAVQLFVDRARATRADFDGGDLVEVGQLVALLDGLPLAIELAAARVRVLPVSGLLARVRDRFALLGGGRDRRATLRGSLDLSWELLDAPGRDALAALSVFVGAFSMDAAEAVLGPGALDPLQRLADHSLVQREGERLRLLATIREYAAEKLAASPDPGGPERRHGAWFARFGTDEAVEAVQATGGDALRRVLHLDREDIVAACRRAVARGDAEVAVGAFCAAWCGLAARAPAGLAAALAEEVGAMADLPPALTARVARDHAAVLQRLATPAEGLQRAERALAAAEACGDPRAVARALVLVDRGLRLLGRFDEAGRRLERALALTERDRGPLRVAVLTAYAGLTGELGRPEGIGVAEEALRLARRVGSDAVVGRVLNILGVQHASAGRFEPAVRALREADARLTRVGELRECVVITYNLAQLHSEHGRVAEAARFSREALSAARQVGDRQLAAMSLSVLGEMEVRLGELDAAELTLDAAAEMVEALALARIDAVVTGNRGRLLAARGRREDAVRAFREAVRKSRDVALPRLEAGFGVSLGALLLDLGDEPAASLALEAAEARLAAQDARLEADLFAQRARAAAHRGDHAAARELLERAEAAATASTTPPDAEVWATLRRVRAGLPG